MSILESMIAHYRVWAADCKESLETMTGRGRDVPVLRILLADLQDANEKALEICERLIRGPSS